MYEVSGDDQLPLLILIVGVLFVDSYQITQSSVNNLTAHIRFMNQYDFTHSRNNELEYLWRCGFRIVIALPRSAQPWTSSDSLKSDGPIM